MLHSSIGGPRADTTDCRDWLRNWLAVTTRCHRLSKVGLSKVGLGKVVRDFMDSKFLIITILLQGLHPIGCSADRTPDGFGIFPRSDDWISSAIGAVPGIKPDNSGSPRTTQCAIWPLAIAGNALTQSEDIKMQTLMNRLPLTTPRGDRQFRLRVAGANGCARNGGEKIDHDNIPHHMIEEDGVVRSRAPENRALSDSSGPALANICAGCTRGCRGRNMIE